MSRLPSIVEQLPRKMVFWVMVAGWVLGVGCWGEEMSPFAVSGVHLRVKRVARRSSRACLTATSTTT